ncbi:hypothetical protein WH50_19955 [Pokkaliibacter plantistimulans]|uniref:Uncharacterized protein n=1 Tax=Pokkaliibacter plantistimulans TaxID=1635171 RepID=A0ABX5LVG1_9GAMM|nr:hypothetical protein [Pokkaliibacter plantistimulans]PXF29600.1 hypothetical protein WH50_19955 [Pokkaliibacter plantistimulans]
MERPPAFASITEVTMFEKQDFLPLCDQIDEQLGNRWVITDRRKEAVIFESPDDAHFELQLLPDYEHQNRWKIQFMPILAGHLPDNPRLKQAIKRMAHDLSPERTPEALARSIDALLIDCRKMIQAFAPENKSHFVMDVVHHKDGLMSMYIENIPEPIGKEINNLLTDWQNSN